MQHITRGRAKDLSRWLMVAWSSACVGDPSCPEGHVERNGACVETSDDKSSLRGDRDRDALSADDEAGVDLADAAHGDASQDDDSQHCFPDRDNDGHGAKGHPIPCDTKGLTVVTIDDDCNDASRAVHGAAAELCDKIDNDCDGRVDESIRSQTFYRDLDGDGFGVTSKTAKGCKPPEGYALVAGDCRDDCATCFPGNSEECDTRDNDCDGKTDEGVVNACGTCGDAPEEVCNGEDDDCDGAKDEGLLNACNGCAPLTEKPGAACNNGKQGRCRATGTWSCDGLDRLKCNYGSPELPPIAETCNKVDDNCDGEVDNLVSSLGDRAIIAANTWYCDKDADGYAALTRPGADPVSCQKPAATKECKDWTKLQPLRDVSVGIDTVDCDETSFRHHPKARAQGVPETSHHTPREDLNCDGKVTKANDRIGIYAGALRYLPVCSPERQCECGKFTETPPTTCHTVADDIFVVNSVEYSSLLQGNGSGAEADYCVLDANKKPEWRRGYRGFRACR